MVVFANPALDKELLLLRPAERSPAAVIPAVDLSLPCAAESLVKACKDVGFFKLVNHGIPLQPMLALEDEALRFFSLPQVDKDAVGPANPFGYGSRSIGRNGDVGWVEYLLFRMVTAGSSSTASTEFLRDGDDSMSSFRAALGEYLSEVQRHAGDVLELMAQGLGMKQRDDLSKLVADDQSDGIFRLNHYPPCPLPEGSMMGFGEHTDPQIISVLRSNITTGLQISLKDGSWVAVPPDREAFFVNVGDALQVLTNGKFRSVEHRVVTEGQSSRLSMIYFFGPPPAQRIAPLAELLGEEESRYREFTWEEYKKAAYKSRLGDNRLSHFEM